MLTDMIKTLSGTFILFLSILFFENDAFGQTAVVKLNQPIVANAPQYSLGDATLVHNCTKYISFALKNTGSVSHTWAFRLYIMDDNSSYYTLIVSDVETIAAGNVAFFDKDVITTGINGMGGVTVNNPGSFKLKLFIEESNDLADVSFSSPLVSCGGGVSGCSNPQQITILNNTNCCNAGCGGGCENPLNFLTTSQASSSISLDWLAPSGGNTVSYTLQNKLSTGSTWSAIASGITATAYNANGLTACTEYDFRIRTNCFGSPSASGWEYLYNVGTTGCGPGTGNVTVYINPIGLTGATWSLDGAGTYASGINVSSVATGTHIISFSNVSGYVTPSNISISVNANQNTTTTGTYTVIAGLTYCPGGCNATVSGFNNIRLTIIKEQMDDYSSQEANNRIKEYGSNIPRTTVFRWSRVFGATKYQVELSDNYDQAIAGYPYISGYTIFEVNDNAQQEYFYKIPGSYLDYSTDYNCKVTARDINNTIVGCELKSFQTMSIPLASNIYGGIVNHFNNILIINNTANGSTQPDWKKRYYQCIDLVRRYYQKIYNVNLWKAKIYNQNTAFTWFTTSGNKPYTGLLAFENNGSRDFEVGDIVCYGKLPPPAISTNTQGHVALIRAVGDNSVFLAQQNVILAEHYDKEVQKIGNVLISIREIKGFLRPNRPRISTMYQSDFPLALSTNAGDPTNIPSNAPLFFWQNVERATYLLNLKRWNGTCFVDEPGYSSFKRNMGAYLNVFSFSAENKTLTNGLYQLCVFANLTDNIGRIRGDFYYFNIMGGVAIAEQMFPPQMISKDIISIGSLVPNAEILYKRGSDTLQYMHSDELSHAFSNFDEPLKITDSLFVKSDGYETISMKADSAFLNQSLYAVPLFVKNPSLNKVKCPSIRLTGDRVTTSNVVQVKVTAKNITSFDIAYSYIPEIYDSISWENHLPADSMINYSLSDTGLNMISIRFNGIVDTLEIMQHLVFYYPVSLLADNTNTISLTVPQAYLGADLYIDNLYYKKLTNTSESVTILKNFADLHTRRFGYEDIHLNIDSSQSNQSFTLVPEVRNYFLESDSLDATLNAQSVGFKNSTSFQNMLTSPTHISFKRAFKNYSAIGIVNLSESFIFRKLSVGTLFNIRTLGCLNQADYLSNDSIYLLNIRGGNQLIKYPVDSLSKWTYDSTYQKLNINRISFKAGTVNTEEFVLAKRLKPLPRESGFMLHLPEDIPFTFAFSSLFLQPDSIAGDMTYQLLSSNPPNISVTATSDSIRVLGNQDWFGMSSVTVQAVHDGLIFSCTIPVKVHPINDPPVFSPVPFFAMCDDDTTHIPLNPYVSDVDNTIDQLTLSGNVTGTNNPAVPASKLKISIDPVSHIATFIADPVSSNTIFYIRYIATDDSLASDTSLSFVNVYSKPATAFSYQLRCLGDTLPFTDLTVANPGSVIISWAWNFGDPSSGYNTSSAQHPGHVFNTAGTFLVSLTATTNQGCSRTVQRSLTVYPSPTVEFTYRLGPEDLTVHFHIDSSSTNLGAIGNMVLWDFGDGAWGYGWNPTHIYPASGTFDVTLSVTDTIGCKGSVTNQIFVPARPMAFFNSNAPICFNKQPACFTDLSRASTPPFGYIKTWVWNFGDGSPKATIHFPNNPNICHTFAMADTFGVQLQVFDNYGFSDSITLKAVILPDPAANFSWSSTLCPDQQVFFSDGSYPNGGGNIISWSWDFGDPGSGTNNLSTLQNPSYIFTNGGKTYNVRLIIENFNNCIDTITKQVYLHPKPPVNFTFAPACLNQLVHFFADTIVTRMDSITFWSWNFGDGTPLVNDPVTTSHLYTAAGIYTVTLMITDLHGCTNFISHTMEVIPLPMAQFSWNSPACHGSSVQFMDASYVNALVAGYVAKWHWDFGDGTSQTVVLPNSPNVTHRYTGPTLGYNVTLTVWSNDSCTTNVTHLVNLIPAPIANFDTNSIHCLQQPAQFMDLSQTNGGGNIIARSWNFGEPSSGGNNFSTLQNPVHSYQNTGTFVVRLVVTNVSNCQDTIEKTITINPKPVANFMLAYTVCVGTASQFTDLSVPNASSIISYSWDFGDGSPLNTQTNPSHTYSNYGDYNVTLSIANSNGCTSSVTEQVLVNPLPTAAFTFVTPNCVGTPVCFTDITTTPPGYLVNVVQWIWDFGDGNTQTVFFPGNPNVCHTFVGAGLSHLVTLTVKTSDSCIGTTSHTVNSASSPIANFSYSTTTCAGQSVNFTDLSQLNGGGEIITWHWDFGDPASGSNNTSNTRNPVHIFTGAGNFNVSLIVFNSGGCSDTVHPAKVVAVNAKPVANFSADRACLGNLTTFNDLSISASGAITIHHWDFGDGGTSPQTNPTHVYANAGNHNVTLTITTEYGCTKDTTLQVFIIQNPVAAFSFSVPTCAGDSVHFTNLSTTQGSVIHTWKWEFGDGQYVTQTFPASPLVNHKYVIAGTYNVKLTVKTTDSCTNFIIMPVIIQARPTANLAFATIRCTKMPVDFTDLSQATGGVPIVAWNWNFGDPTSGITNTSNIQNPSHSFNAEGNFNARLFITNANGCIDSITKVVTINAAPKPKFISDTACNASATHFTDQSTSGSGNLVAWQWDFGEPSSGTNNTSTLQNPTHTYAGPGTYNVTLTVTNSNSCQQDTAILVIVNPKPQAMFSGTTACKGDSTHFTDLSIAPGSQVVNWLWKFGDGATDSVQNTWHTYATSGTFSVHLIITNLAGCIDSVVQLIVVRPKPFGAFTYTSFFGPKGQVNFQDRSMGVAAAIIGHEWTFELGATSNLVNPIFTYANTDTTYLVTEIVTDTYGCADTVADSVYVKPGYMFTFTYDTVCFNTFTHFLPINQAAGDSLYSPVWDFGDPNSGLNNKSYAYNPTHKFTQPGSYVVKLKTTNSDNFSDSVFNVVIVRALPKPFFKYSTLPCDSVVSLSDSSFAGSGSIAMWIWSFGDGTTGTINAPRVNGDTSHVYRLPYGYRTVNLTVVNQYGCSDSVTHIIQTFPCILAKYNVQDTICARYPVIFNDSSAPTNKITSWYWNFGDGTGPGHDTTYTTHTGQVTHIFADSGRYTVKLKITALVNTVAFQDSMVQYVVVRSTLIPCFSNPGVCRNQLTLLSDTSRTLGKGVTKWWWNFGDVGSTNNTDTIKNTSHKYNTAGIYDVKLILMNRWGCKDSLTKPTRVYNLPVADFSNSVSCEGNPTYFNDKSIIGDTTMIVWHWNFGDLTSRIDTAGIKDPVYKYQNPGFDSVRLIVKDGFGCQDTVDLTIQVNVTPVSSFTLINNLDGMTGKIQMNNLSVGATMFDWDFGNGHRDATTNPVATYTLDGTYLISLVSINDFNCSDTTFYKHEVLFKGLYVPNAFSPTNTNPSIRIFKPIGTNLKQYDIQVYDSWGHLVWESNKIDKEGRPMEGWDGTYNDQLMPQAIYMWKASATFIDNTIWQGSDIGKGEVKNSGTVWLIR